MVEFNKILKTGVFGLKFSQVVSCNWNYKAIKPLLIMSLCMSQDATREEERDDPLPVCCCKYLTGESARGALSSRNILIDNSLLLKYWILSLAPAIKLLIFHVWRELESWKCSVRAWVLPTYHWQRSVDDGSMNPKPEEQDIRTQVCSS